MREFVRIRICLLAALICFILAPTEASAADRLQDTGDNLVVVIDPGHGGDNDGTLEGYILEKEMTLRTAKALADELSKYENVTVYLTRTDDTSLSLKDRAAFAAGVQADFLFSIHYNASDDHQLYGSEVWVSKFPPYNGYGYQFGMVQMQTMQDYGLFLRGVKTKPGKEDLDYYGIIREARDLSIPAVIIEHCHVDNEHDAGFLGSDELLEEFGRLDATSIAKYFGLKSSRLGVDYSESLIDNLPNASADFPNKPTIFDDTAPEVCRIEKLSVDEENAKASFLVSGADYDGVLLYYDYSTDGGYTWSERFPWPGADIFLGTYDDTFQLDLSFEPGDRPFLYVRAYNQYDLDTKSNDYQFTKTFPYPEPEVTEESAKAEEEAEEVQPQPEEKPSATGLAAFFENRKAEAQSGDSVLTFRSFLILALGIVVLLFLILMSVQVVLLLARPRKKQRGKDQKTVSKRHVPDFYEDPDDEDDL